MALWAKEYDLKVPLKEWHFPASRLSRHWLTYYDYATDNLYVHHQDTFLQYTRNQEEGIFHSDQDFEWTPTDSAVPLKVNTYGGAKSWTGHYCYGLHKSIPYSSDGTFQNVAVFGKISGWSVSVGRCGVHWQLLANLSTFSTPLIHPLKKSRIWMHVHLILKAYLLPRTHKHGVSVCGILCRESLKP